MSLAPPDGVGEGDHARAGDPESRSRDPHAETGGAVVCPLCGREAVNAITVGEVRIVGCYCVGDRYGGRYGGIYIDNREWSKVIDQYVNKNLLTKGVA